MRNENKIKALCVKITEEPELMAMVVPHVPEDPTDMDILEYMLGVLYPNAKMVHFEQKRPIIEIVDDIFDNVTEFGKWHMILAVFIALVYFKE